MEKDLKIVISGDSSGGESAIRNLGGSLDSLNSFSVAAGIALEQLGAKILDLGKNALEFSVNYAANIEQARIAFDTFTGSTQKGGAALQEVSELARKMPFQLPDVQHASEMILAMGLASDNTSASINNETNTLKTSTITTNAYGETVAKVSKNNTAVLDAATTKLKEQTAQLAILNEEHVKAGLATDKHNLAVMRLQDSIAKTKETIAQHTLTVKSVTSAYSAATVQGESLGQMLTDIGDLAAATNQPLSVAVDLFAHAKEGIMRTMEMAQFGISRQDLEQFGVQFNKAGAAINKSELVPALEKLIHLKFGGLMEKESQTFHGTMINIQDDVGRLAGLIVGVNEQGDIQKGGIFDQLKTAAQTFLTWMDAHQNDIIATFQSIFDTIKSVFGTIANVIKPVLPVLNEFFSNIENRKNVIMAVLAEIGIAFVVLAATIIGPLLVPIAVISAIGAAIFLLSEAWNTNFLGIRDKTQGLINFITGTFLPAINNMVGWVKDQATFLKDHWAFVIGEIIGFFLTLPLKIPLIMIELIAKIVGIIAKTDWDKVFKDIWTFLTKQFNDAVDYIKKIDWGKIIKDIISTFGHVAFDALKGLVSGVVSGTPLQQRASGGYASGLTLVGEQGPELVSLPSGSYVHNNNQTRQMMSSPTININNPTVRSDNDIRDIVAQVAAVLGRQNELMRLGAF